MYKTLLHPSKTNSQYTLDIPVIGLGVWQIPADVHTEKAVKWALDEGYRHIDTAQIYNNEKQVGKIIQGRDDVFVTTKLWEDSFGYDNTIKACENSLSKLNRIDLFLVHSPHRPELRKETWDAMQYLLKNNYVGAIGVSNFGTHHINEILDFAEIGPCINQIEISPFLQRTELVNFCNSNSISVTAYSPLTHGRMINNPKLQIIAERYKKTPAQVLIRWSMQKGNIVIPKSSNKDRIEQNFRIFDFTLNPEDMNLLNQFDQNLITCWDPTVEP